MKIYLAGTTRSCDLPDNRFATRLGNVVRATDPAKALRFALQPKSHRDVACGIKEWVL